MDIKQYFENELSYLRNQGKEFSDLYPKLSEFLSEESADPDVERLLEGFAFLTARLRQKVEDQFPELTHSILNLLWPNYLRIIPSICIIKFNPLEDSITAKKTIEKGTILRSRAIDGVECEFRTTSDLNVYPFNIINIDDIHTQKTSKITLSLQSFKGITFNKMSFSFVELYFFGDYSQASTLYLWFSRYLNSINLVKPCGETISIPTDLVQPSGLGADEGILPYEDNSFVGYRLLQEFFTFPEKFLSISLGDLSHFVNGVDSEELSIEFVFNRIIPTSIRIDKESIQLYCIPAVNLFSMSAEPLKSQGFKHDYLVTPKADKGSCYEIFSIERVEGWVIDNAGNAVENTRALYQEFESFRHGVDSPTKRHIVYYKSKVKEALNKEGVDHNISFLYEDEANALNTSDVITLDLLCSNRSLPIDLNIGDIRFTTIDSPTFVDFTNITKPTSPVRPILDGSLYWRLISNLSLNYTSLLNKDALISVMSAYDFLAQQDRQAERTATRRYDGIKSLVSKPVDMIFKGLPIRGLSTVIELDETYYLSEGDMFLFSTVLAEFFSLYASINSFHTLEVINIANNENYKWHWGAKKGQQPII